MQKRKAITKKLRFDVFKRDSFTCQYCGSVPPNVVLEIDHINPVSLGGDNSIDNLITSCFECNRGKAANSLSGIPKTIKQKAQTLKEQEAQITAYNELVKEKASRLELESWEVAETLEADLLEEYDRKRMHDIKQFLNRLPLHEVVEAAEITSFKFNKITNYSFRYFCGICWNKIRDDENG